MRALQQRKNRKEDRSDILGRPCLKVSLRWINPTSVFGGSRFHLRRELWSLLEFMIPDLFATEDVDLKKLLNVEDRELVGRMKYIMGPFILRRLKSDVMQQLVPNMQRVDAFLLLDRVIEELRNYNDFSIHQAVDTVVAGILHDVVDDTCESLFSIEAEFGDDVARLVAGVSRLSYINQLLRRHRRINVNQSSLGHEEVPAVGRFTVKGTLSNWRDIIPALYAFCGVCFKNAAIDLDFLWRFYFTNAANISGAGMAGASCGVFVIAASDLAALKNAAIELKKCR
ncbi:hypothetical protein F3Y22_tig00000773pilonHSYRG00271 [Hibiscus syriacus]|uniref:Uncharacterized protein n=1 Tax=Hibiscus syriacus TaxID=106335 RepID=A0A6A3D4R3_HIBSY|nr:hypothetical protein F3Y22_tig00000773pilonHSYRG00271 [Hibiscus syriacus]